ncbi:deoxyribose-phosphate aldolase [Muricauda sp. SCSIO 64092]|uniref:DUF6503 family protein n=1 Tax=Allomuricauda sp. SCSIO 64092 TaxID=2908842 RepID=UPI001FF25B29|nr:DUF6503 family protein [Muricauda sp. SCSIO 64092]UOY06907.1 deoxyribose-phosphate aldolase [Muricauda sp. SCSIO 64092]
MKSFLYLFLVLGLLSCKSSTDNEMTVQQIVDKSIQISGGEGYDNSKISFVFRDRTYESLNRNGKKLLKRITRTDSVTITDKKTNTDFQRFFNDSLIVLPDTLANTYANSVNSVHYFSRLPLGLNDKAVKKELLGEHMINEKTYYKVKVTFSQESGGDDFEDTYLYWFEKQSFKPEYLAYEFHVNGGGIRFREAYNERYVGGIRFVDYNNFKPQKGAQVDFFKIDSLFEKNELELLSKIELENIQVTPID